MRGARSIADAIVPTSGVSLRVNSRGETVVRTRAAEERQTTVFLDGAPLTTNWDGRVDLGALPAGLIDSAKVVRGAVPIEFGPNSIGGTIELFPPSPGDRTRVAAEAGLAEIGGSQASGLISIPFQQSGGGLVLAASHSELAAETIASRQPIPFEAGEGRSRLNTDSTKSAVYAAAEKRSGDLAVRLSWLHADVERGIAAEGHLDPATASPRYWRYPQWNLDQWVASLNMEREAGSVRAVVWRQHYSQAIDAFADATYSRRVAREYGQDRATGARVAALIPLKGVSFRLVGFASDNRHVQQNQRLSAGALVASAPLNFSQRLLSYGAEADIPLRSVALTFGVGRDHADMPLTGDKPPQPSQAAWAWSAAATIRVAPTLSITLSGAQRTRFASPRELFGEALGRFVPNPDLKPEIGRQADLELVWKPAPGFSLTGTIWASGTDGTIGQRVVRVAGVSRRQRYNMLSSQSRGVEIIGDVALSDRLTVRGYASVLRSATREQFDAASLPLIQRPSSDVSLSAIWAASRHTRARVGLQRTDWGIDLDQTGKQVRLGAALLLDMSVEQQVGPIALFAAVRNLTNGSALPQLGLPLPGRTASFGLRWLTR